MGRRRSRAPLSARRCRPRPRTPPSRARTGRSRSSRGRPRSWTMNPDGTGQTQHHDRSSGQVDPAWSPDGTQDRVRLGARLDHAMRAHRPCPCHERGRSRSDDRADHPLDRHGPAGHRTASSSHSLRDASTPSIVDARWTSLSMADVDGRTAHAIATDDVHRRIADPASGPLDRTEWSSDGTRSRSATTSTNRRTMLRDQPDGRLYGLGWRADRPAATDRPTGSLVTRLEQVGGGIRRDFTIDLGGNDLYTMNRDGDRAHEADVAPTWSPDGTQLVSRRDEAGRRANDPASTCSSMQSGRHRHRRSSRSWRPVVGPDPDWQPIPINAYPRPVGASPMRVSLVPAYEPCSSPNRTHGPPLGFGSCNPPPRSPAS